MELHPKRVCVGFVPERLLSKVACLWATFQVSALPPRGVQFVWGANSLGGPRRGGNGRNKPQVRMWGRKLSRIGLRSWTNIDANLALRSRLLA